jgi:hypothetical protein
MSNMNIVSSPDNGTRWYYSNLCYLQKLTVGELAPIKKEIEKIKSDMANAEKYNSKLAGNIVNEYKLKDSFTHTEKLILRYVIEADKEIGWLQTLNTNTSNAPIILESLWVNFQKKYEFNPPHIHTGAYSFVIWYDIPYKIEDEVKYSPGSKSNKPVPGHFSFLYPSTIGSGLEEMHIPADKSWNGTLCVFPSKLTHQVFPFYTSDDYRITVSGNVMFDVVGNFDILQRQGGYE